MEERVRYLVGLATAALLALAGAAAAQDPAPGAKLVINGNQEMTVRAKAPDYLPNLSEIYSGWLFRSPSTRAIETDDFENPGMVAVDAGNALWSRADGSAGKSCADCHNGIESMKGVRASMPKVNKKGKLWSLEDYVNDCRVNRMGAKAWGWDSKEMLNMTAAISVQSRGMPVAVKIDGAAAPFWEEGKKMYYTRTGLLQLSCANCHEDNFGNRIRGDRLSQGQINGFPTYRLKSGGLVSIQKRFYGCIRDTRAESYKPGSDALRALELYVASRGNGLSVEGVAVRP